MCWMCDHPTATFDDYLEDVVRPTIALCGCAVQATTWHDAPLAYTVGRAERGEPELVVTGKPPDEAYDLLEALLAGEERPSAGMRCDLLRGPALWALPVERPAVLTVAWKLFPGLSALQVVWADRFGDWPWDARESRQLLLARPDDSWLLAG